MVKNITFLLIEIYQKIFSPSKGLFSFMFPSGVCRFYPSCSDYVKEAIEKYGILRGFYLGAKRVLRCSPLSRGGVDFVK